MPFVPRGQKAPMWEELPVKITEDGLKLCALEWCQSPLYAKHLCQAHYNAARKGQLDPTTGRNKAEVANDEPAEGEEKAQNLKFGDPKAWVYIIQTQTLINRISGKRVPLLSAALAWGGWIKDAVKEGKIERFWSETFLPGDPPPEVADHYNSYMQLESMTPISSGGVPLDPLLELLLQNLGGNSVEYLKDWLAFGMKHYDRGSVALVLHGVPGAGKGVLTSILKALYGPYLHTVNAATLQNEFNAWIERKLMIVANEIASGSFRERQHTMDRLKEWVMPDLIEINKKGINQYQYQNCSRWIFCSNDKHPVDIEADDRRYSVIFSTKKIDPDLGKYLSENAPMFARNLLEHLAFRDISKFEPMRPLENDDRTTVKNRLATLGKVVNLR